MPKLETEINQIFLTRSEAKINLQILHDEVVSASSHVFLVAEIKDVARKTEEADLKKICESILSIFRKNKKLPGEALFESSLAEINESLADLAHKGRKSTLPKLSACLALKNGDNLYLSNTGRGIALLKRGAEFSEILSVEKKDPLPLKTFQNFTIGKIKDADCVVITLNNLFNYIALPLFTKTLATATAEEAVRKFTQILKDSTGQEGFACFVLRFLKLQPTKPVVHLPEPNEDLYAPLPETELQTTPGHKSRLRAISESVLGKIKEIQLIGQARAAPLVRLSRIPNFGFRISEFYRLSPARKFFLISFLIFVLLFGINVIAFAFRLSGKKHLEKVGAQTIIVNDFLNEAEGALIYRNDEQAFLNLNSAWEEFERLQKLDPAKASQIKPSIDEINDKINRISKIEQPQVAAELKFKPLFLAKAGNGFLLSDNDSKTLTLLDSQNIERNIFLLNNPSEEIAGIIHIQGLGHLFAAGSKIYLANESSRQAELLYDFEGSPRNEGNPLDARGLKPGASRRLYTADVSNKKILRFTLNANPQAVLSFPEGLKDFGLDRDFYLLYPDRIRKYVDGSEQLFRLTPLSQPMTEAQKIQVGVNLYILEPSKKRLLIYSKQGRILNQIVFPNNSALADFYVDEQQRSIYLLDGNRLLSITF